MESTSHTKIAKDWINELEKPLLRFAISLGLSTHDAQDIVQESLIALTQKLSNNSDPIFNPRAYSFTIVRNGAYKFLKNKSSQNEIEISDKHPTPEKEVNIYSEPLINTVFSSAYLKLTAKEQDLLDKYYVEGSTYQQIGSELGCSAQNAWKTIKLIVVRTLAGEMKKTLTEIDPEFARELFPH